MSTDPAGPFEVQGCLNTSQPLFSDYSLFADPTDDSAAFVIYNSPSSPGQFIEKLTPDFTAVIKNTSKTPSSTHIAQDQCQKGGCEAPLMFVRNGIYYALFGHNCWW